MHTPPTMDDEPILFVDDVARLQAERQPDAVALVCEGRETLFAALHRRANQVANGLAAMPSRSGRVALLDTNADTFYELLFGAARARRTLVPLNARLAVPELAYILNDAEADVLVIGRDFVGHLDALLSACSKIRHVIALGGETVQWHSYADWRDAQPDTEPLASSSPSDVLLQMYTSGTTGHPKGAMLTHENLLVVSQVLLREYGCRREDVSLVCLPLFHVSGGLWGLASLFAGMKTVIMRQSVPADILRTIEAHRVTKTFLVPALIMFLLQEPTRASRDCSSLDLIVYGASPIPVPLLQSALDAFRCRFAQAYGLTESAGALTHLQPIDHDVTNPSRLQSCGRPLHGVELRIVDEGGRDVPVGQNGEIVCRSRQIMAGYWKGSSQPDEVFRDGWFRTGDIGCVDANGYVYIHDRLKDMIITGGEKVFPAEVELALTQHPAVAEAAVIGIPDDRWGEAIRAVVVRRPGADVSADELIGWTHERLARFKRPKSITFATVLPRNAAGKVLKRELRASKGE